MYLVLLKSEWDKLNENNRNGLRDWMIAFNGNERAVSNIIRLGGYFQFDATNPNLLESVRIWCAIFKCFRMVPTEQHAEELVSEDKKKRIS